MRTKTSLVPDQRDREEFLLEGSVTAAENCSSPGDARPLSRWDDADEMSEFVG